MAFQHVFLNYKSMIFCLLISEITFESLTRLGTIFNVPIIIDQLQHLYKFQDFFCKENNIHNFLTLNCEKTSKLKRWEI